MLVADIQEFSAQLPVDGRLIGLDHGSKTIGVALSDALRGMASPLETINKRKFSADVERLKAIVTQEKVAGFVIGYPLNMDGSEGERCQSVRAFVRNLEVHFDLPILLWDERLSSSTATDQMITSGVRAARRSDKIDKIAAAVILQGMLEHLQK